MEWLPNTYPSIITALTQLKTNDANAKTDDVESNKTIAFDDPADVETLIKQLDAKAQEADRSRLTFTYEACVSAKNEILTNFRPGKNSIVTLGSQGAVFISAEGQVTKVGAPKVTAVDTTGAGDAFVGTFAFSLASGKDPVTAMTLGVNVASFSVTRKGAQISYPDKVTVTKYLNSLAF